MTTETNNTETKQYPPLDEWVMDRLSRYDFGWVDKGLSDKVLNGYREINSTLVKDEEVKEMLMIKWMENVKKIKGEVWWNKEVEKWMRSIYNN